jgi:hypothetical protein
VHRLKLKNISEWFVYARSGKKPHDIPATPQTVYADAGWAGFGDWLGARIRRHGGWRPFKAARAFVHGLKLKNNKEWVAYARSGKKPHDIPKRPDLVYADSGWVSLGDWLGTGHRKGDWRSFEDARAFVHRLKFAAVVKLAFVRANTSPHVFISASRRTQL